MWRPEVNPRLDELDCASSASHQRSPGVGRRVGDIPARWPSAFAIRPGFDAHTTRCPARCPTPNGRRWSARSTTIPGSKLWRGRADVIQYPHCHHHHHVLIVWRDRYKACGRTDGRRQKIRWQSAGIPVEKISARVSGERGGVMEFLTIVKVKEDSKIKIKMK